MGLGSYQRVGSYQGTGLAVFVRLSWNTTQRRLRACHVHQAPRVLQRDTLVVSRGYLENIFKPRWASQAHNRSLTMFTETKVGESSQAAEILGRTHIMLEINGGEAGRCRYLIDSPLELKMQATSGRTALYFFKFRLGTLEVFAILWFWNRVLRRCHPKKPLRRMRLKPVPTGESKCS